MASHFCDVLVTWKSSNLVLNEEKVVPFSTFTSDAGIKAVPSCLSAVIVQISTVVLIPLILAPYIPSTSHSE